MFNRIRKIKKICLDIVKNMFFRLLFFFKTPIDRKTKYYFSLCCIFKNEAAYFKEWIEYHKILGVDHIYAYNNFSTDNFMDVLKPYIEEGYVTLLDWPHELGQISAYEDCFRMFRSENYWLCFLDLDEFICPYEATSIKDWIKPFEKFPSVELYWLMFGTNGIVDYDKNKLVIEQYTHSWNTIRNVGKQVLNTAYEPVQMYHHYIFCHVSFLGLDLHVPSINEGGNFILDYNNHKCPKHNTIQINHYWSKCLAEYVRKIDKGDMFAKKNDEIRKDMSFFYWHEHQNVREDKVIFRFLAELKMAIYGIKLIFKQNE
jgi:hypothetical protein